MTTAPTTPRRGFDASGLRVLAGAGLVGTAAGSALAVVGALSSGGPAAGGALVGTGFAVAVFAFGALTVEAVSHVLPAASLLVAMLTYALQVVAMALFMVALDGSGALDHDLDGRWLGGAVIAVTMCWLAAQLVLTTRRRIPVFDLSQNEASHATQGSAR